MTGVFRVECYELNTPEKTGNQLDVIGMKN